MFIFSSLTASASSLSGGVAEMKETRKKRHVMKMSWKCRKNIWWNFVVSGNIFCQFSFFTLIFVENVIFFRFKDFPDLLTFGSWNHHEVSIYTFLIYIAPTFNRNQTNLDFFQRNLRALNSTLTTRRLFATFINYNFPYFMSLVVMTQDSSLAESNHDKNFQRKKFYSILMFNFHHFLKANEDKVSK